MRTFKILTPLICVLAVFGAAPKAAKGDEVIEGPATVIDGQTLTVAGRTMRLHGLMAPPKDLICHTKHDKPYKCGWLAVKALVDMVMGQRLSCTLTPSPVVEGELPAAVCYVGPFSINQQLLLTGRVVAVASAGADYKRAEDGARRLNEGLWKGRFQPPAEWKR
jgi:endonuclease YncB( thermonuclease family)